jgi:1,4-dihydroxy-2-naphthoate octaprenyltransferase
MLLTAATLGVAAHLLNTLPDLDGDGGTGIRGLPHRVGERVSRVVATSLLLVGRGKVPFHAATAIALVNVTLLVVVVP